MKVRQLEEDDGGNKRNFFFRIGMKTQRDRQKMNLNNKVRVGIFHYNHGAIIFPEQTHILLLFNFLAVFDNQDEFSSSYQKWGGIQVQT